MPVRLLVSLWIIVLCGCSTSMQGLADVARVYWGGGNHQVARTALDARYRYLRISVRGRATLMILGYVDRDPLGPIETWYSGHGKETLRLQNGRVVGGTGLPVEWTSVQLSAQPAWRSLSGAATIERRRDVMPGYAYGLTDTLTVTPIPMPRGTAYFGQPDPGLRWFVESSTGAAPLPPASYATRTVGNATTVVYGEQCLDKTFCLSWQRWPVNS
ncbi:lipoprotein [Burkholderia pseudomallei]|nr:lipoprotein [Burkholderia pseudomallei]CAJ3830989.1 lipoprotein [Burkholderia pseudomallei]CAJ4390464.1 lipoprotein [Burkholderia pseudomallei]CAJ5665120.1 lipoprotein [Burkholderia pseudomallei]CAJ6352478.1 lipoprotein [Burkholderia pseudomallei]